MKGVSTHFDLNEAVTGTDHVYKEVSISEQGQGLDSNGEVTENSEQGSDSNGEVDYEVEISVKWLRIVNKVQIQMG